MSNYQTIQSLSAIMIEGGREGGGFYIYIYIFTGMSLESGSLGVDGPAFLFDWALGLLSSLEQNRS